jgi:hypothetical protein
MIQEKARLTIKTAALAVALLCAPVAMHAQTADSTQANYGTTSSGRHFDWGWLGLLGLLGLLPKKRKTETDTRPAGTTNTGTGARY